MKYINSFIKNIYDDVLMQILITLIILIIIYILRKPTNIFEKLIKKQSLPTFVLTDTDFKKDNNIPQSKYIINIEIVEEIINMLKQIDPTKGCNIILHTHGGESQAPDTLSLLLSKCQNVNIFIPEFAESAGTMIALSGNNIYMNWYSVTSPIDPQLDYDHDNELENTYSSKYIKELSKCKPKDDKQYLQGCEAKAAYNECEYFIHKILKEHEHIDLIIDTLLNTDYSHDINFTRDDLAEIGLPIVNDVPKDIMNIFNNFIS